MPCFTSITAALLALVLLAGRTHSQSLSTSLAGPGFNLLNSTGYAFGAGTPLFSYPVGFPLITCNATQASPTQAVNVSITPRSLVPASRADATSPLPAIQATVRVAWPNNVTGPSVGIDQTVFELTDDIFYNLGTGDIWALNGTQYITFNQSLDGASARGTNGSRSVQTLQYVSPASLYSGGAGLDYTEIPVARGANQTNGTSPSAVYLTASRPWTKAVERLFYYTQLVTMQAATTAPCTNDSSGYYQLTPVVNYLLNAVLPVNTTYSPRALTLLDNVTLPNIVGLQPVFYTSNLSTAGPHYTDLVSSASFLPVNTTLDIFTTPVNSSGTGMTQCLIACRQYRPANPEIPHCNIWNWCNGTTNCTYALNATRNSIPTRTCLLGYSSAAAVNLPVSPVNLANAGYWSGRNTAVRPFNLTGSVASADITSTNYAVPAPVQPTNANTTAAGNATAPTAGNATLPAPSAAPPAAVPALATNASSPPTPSATPASPRSAAVSPAARNATSSAPATASSGR